MANDEDLLESSPGKKFQVDIVLLIVILFSAVATKLLRKATEPFSVWVTSACYREPSKIVELKKEVERARIQLAKFNHQDEFAEYSRAQRALSKKETSLQELERSYRSNLFRHTIIARSVSFIFIQLLRLLVVVFFRGQPVVRLPPHSLWPIAPLLAFPTGIPGAVGVPCWNIMCALALETCSF